ncbi:MAG: Rpn family recombination-promoting nuclease/putative transposase [Deltaproteobacteria bacterium]|nr:Rpn family recombination-promoting nuclease/putative transposase [Deltaproteobacteria bacterium]MBF0526186.1 Rpn family recombination-promoting nuclease/putative transposase [Deltaproteobacteria bacterium]
MNNYLPDQVLHLLDLNTLEMVKDSFVDKQQAHFADLIYRVQTTSPKPAYVCLLLEHKSYTDPQVPVQLLRYMAQIWNQLLDQKPVPKPLPVVIPLVIYHGASNWAGPYTLSSLFDVDSEFTRFFPEFEYLLYNLSAIQDENIRGAAKTRMTLLLQKYINDDNLPAKLTELARISTELPAGWSRDNYLRTVGQYLLDRDKLTTKELDHFFDKA